MRNNIELRTLLCLTQIVHVADYVDGRKEVTPSPPKLYASAIQEAGVNPAQSHHCKRGASPHHCLRTGRCDVHGIDLRSQDIGASSYRRRE
jgi:hypothetical protein